jgi:hypothetical protein
MPMALPIRMKLPVATSSRANMNSGSLTVASDKTCLRKHRKHFPSCNRRGLALNDLIVPGLAEGPIAILEADQL